MAVFLILHYIHVCSKNFLLTHFTALIRDFPSSYSSRVHDYVCTVYSLSWFC